MSERTSVVDKIGAGLVVGYAILSMGIAPFAAWMAYDASTYASLMERLEEHHRSRHEYLFEAANKRGLLDICNRDGSIDVYFKDDCRDAAEAAGVPVRRVGGGE